MKPDHLAQANLNKLGMVSVDTALEAFIWTLKARLLIFKVKTEEHLYEKSSQRQIGVGTLVCSKDQIVLCVALTDCT